MRALAATSVGAAVAIAVAVAAVAARHAHPAEVSPVAPGGAWHTVWVAAIVGAVVLFALGWLLSRRGMPVAIAVGLAVVIQALPLVSPLLLSKDVYMYWATSRIVTVHDRNPYVATVDDFPSDPSSPYPSGDWRSYPAVYGPAWEALALAPGVASGSSANRAQLLYRLFAFTGILAIVALVARYRRDAAAVALVGWCPLVALHYAGGGHADAWLMAFLVTATFGSVSTSGGALWALAAAVKPVPVILLPLELARRRLRVTRAWWIGLAAAATAIGVAATAAFGRYWLTEQARALHRESGYPAPLGLVHWLTQLGLRHGIAVVAAGAAFAIVYLLLMRSAWRTGRSRLALAAAVLVFTSTLIRPWYGLWPLALAAVEGDFAGGAAAVALSAYLLLADAVPF